MKTNVELEFKISAAKMADALTSATPVEFANVFCEFSKFVLTNYNNPINILHDFAAEIADRKSGNPRIVLKELVRLITYYEIKNAKKD